MKRTACWGFYVGPLLVWLAVIFFASTPAGSNNHSATIVGRVVVWVVAHFAPHIPVTREGIELCNLFFRKGAHLTEYAIVALLACRAFQFGRPQLRARSLLLAMLFSAAYAAADELHQRFVPGRTSLPDDVLVDAVGAGLALGALAAWSAIRGAESRLQAWVGAEGGAAGLRLEGADAPALEREDLPPFPDTAARDHSVHEPAPSTAGSREPAAERGIDK